MDRMAWPTMTMPQAKRAILFLQVCIVISVIISSQTLAAKTLSVTSFNIRYYGLETSVDKETAGIDHRNRWIKDFMEAADITSDVIMFEEIVDMVEVLLSLGKELGFTEGDIIDTVHQKRQERGAFDQGLFLVDILPARRKTEAG